MDAQKLDFLLLDQMLSQLVTSKRLEQRRNLQLGQRRLLRTTQAASSGARATMSDKSTNKASAVTRGSSCDASQKNSPTSCKQVRPTHADTVVSSKSITKKQPVTQTVGTDTEKADGSSSFTATVMTRGFYKCC